VGKKTKYAAPLLGISRKMSSTAGLAEELEAHF